MYYIAWVYAFWFGPTFFFWPSSLCYAVTQQSQSHYLFPMPLKWKDSAVSEPKAKCTKSTPTFQTPTTNAAGLKATATSEINSTKNWVVTLQASASGCCGYCTQDLATSSNSNNASPAAELSDLPSHISDECNSKLHPTEESDIHSRAKQKNTTTVWQLLFIAGIPLTYLQYRQNLLTGWSIDKLA